MSTIVKPTTVDAARKRVAELHQSELEYARRLMAMQAELAGVRDQTIPGIVRTTRNPDDVLASVESMATLKTRVASHEWAIDVTRAERRDWILAVYRAEATEKRDQAAAIRREVDTRVARRQALLDELQELEGKKYVPVNANLFRSGAGTEVVIRKTHSDDLLRQAESLENQAASLERQTVSASGSVQALGRDDLLATVAAIPVMTIGPRLDSVAHWYGERAHALGATEQNPLEVTLHWTQGAVHSGSPASFPARAGQAA